MNVRIILHEVTPNGGGSMKDHVLALDKKNEDQTKRLRRLENEVLGSSPEPTNELKTKITQNQTEQSGDEL